MKKMMFIFVLWTAIMAGCPKESTEPSGPGKPKNEPKPPTPRTSNELVEIKGGSFSMHRQTAIGRPMEPFTMTLNTFSIGKYKVTQKEWKELMKTDPVKAWVENDFFGPKNKNLLGDKKPVFNVSYYDALEYLNKLSEKERLENVYTINKNSSNDQNSWSATGDHTKNGYRLPSEAEWEYASLAGQPASTYNNNEDYVGGFYATGSKKANAFGVHDMFHSLWEYLWTSTKSPYPTTPELQAKYPVNPADKGDIFGRGGNGSITGRAGHYAPSPSGSWGFRIAKN